jgi:hypothetical protein
MIEELERDGLIKKLPVDRKKIRDAMALAHRDVKTSLRFLQMIVTGRTLLPITQYSRLVVP